VPDLIPTVPGDLPSSRQLARSTLIAAGVASFLLVTAVLPAEYGIDPTGIGRVLGLTRMGEIKLALAREAARKGNASGTSEASPAGAVATVSSRSDTTSITLQPNEGKEIKLAMRQAGRVTFSWSTDRGEVNYDLHADSADPPRDYHGYRKGKGVARAEGVLEAAFDGWHGWHWRNKTTAPLTVTLRTEGEYREVKELD